jgi:phenylalanyl-tRNA synthetase beta chain
LRAIALNASHRYPEVGLFEVGNVFAPDGRGGVPTETERLAVAISGQDARTASRIWRLLTDALRIRHPEMEELELPGLHPTRASAVRVGGTAVGIGCVGEVDPAVLEAFDIHGRVAWLEVDLVALLAARDAVPEYQPISRFPSSDIDLAFVVDDAVPAARVERVLREAGAPLLVEVALFDVFRGEQLGGGRRSLAYRLRFNALDHTLTDDEVAAVRARCIAAVETECGAALRG